MKRIAVLLAAAMLAIPAFAMAGEKEGENLTLDKVPAAVKATIEKETAGGTIKSIEKETEEGKVVYECTYKDKDGAKHAIEIAEDGKVLEREAGDDD